MLKSLSHKLMLLIVITLTLFVLTVTSMKALLSTQQSNQRSMEVLIHLQHQVDRIQSQLWTYLQYQDEPSLTNIEKSQVHLEAFLNTAPDWLDKRHHLFRLNRDLSSLIAFEQGYQRVSPPFNNTLRGIDILNARYDMITQSMKDAVGQIQRQIISTNTLIHRTTLIATSTKLLAFTVVIMVISYIIFRHTQTGFRVLNRRISKLANGDMDSQIACANLDLEFDTIAKQFNSMTAQLKNITFSRDELKAEIEKQTQILTTQKEELVYLSEHDSLTGLLNRRALTEALETAIHKAKRTKYKLAVLFIDLDKFKAVNDHYGHSAGDFVLQTTAKRISDNIRESDFAGRLGGDEFVICLDLVDNFVALQPKIKQIHAVIKEPIYWQDQELSVGASIGVSYYPDDTQNTHELLTLADQRMYTDKKATSI
ncbi:MULTISPECIES: diguanylate cyclase [unclassified Vibrio]|uniref:Diguanylate cyclase n=1 Tax=Vibrio sp. HB236076 TaxID=3232307 RepID=A0AB39HI42_9VIBR|nr:diguanylate cyclase [Vibrio sp. HB161653]MDP5252690.1 diguanylate cyclase [Vibrio sp. HB161653]